MTGLLQVLFLSALGSCDSTGASIWDDLDRFYRWGEYDSIVVLVTPWLENPQCEEALPEVLAKLGVAYQALRDTVRGDSAFAEALRRRPDLQLDRHYASAAIQARFRRFSEEAGVIKSESHGSHGVNDLTPSLPQVHSQVPKGIRPWIYWSSAVIFIGGAATTYLYLVQIREPTDVFTTFDMR